MVNQPTAKDRLMDRRSVLRTGAALAAAAATWSACPSADPTQWSVANGDHRCPGPCLRGEHARAALVQRAQLASSRHRR
jgi:TAT (twin-arginine translocation) pathway signal sequence